jgi:hypothetical protein
LKTSELRATKGLWLKEANLAELQSKKALLGWCPEAVVLLGTDSARADVKWSDAEVKRTTWHWTGANLQFTAQSATPLQIGGGAGLSFSRSINTLRFSPSRNYLKCLTSSAMEQIVVYDVSEERAWLVPLLCVLHHMLLVYSKTIQEEYETARVPQAEPASDGASASLDALRDKGQVVIQESGGDNLTVRELLMGFSTNLSKASLQQPHRSKIYGYEFMDIVMDSPRSELKKKRIEKDGLAWTSLLSDVNCLFCSGLGDAMVGKRAISLDSPCNRLPRGHDLMAASMRSIDALSKKQGGSSNHMTGMTHQFSSSHFWLLTGAPFQRCRYRDDDDSQVSCWKQPQFLQEIQCRRASPSPSDDPTAIGDYPNGAVVFGRSRRERRPFVIELAIGGGNEVYLLRFETVQRTKTVHALTG